MNCQHDCVIVKGREEIIKALREDLENTRIDLTNLKQRLDLWDQDEEYE